MKTKTEYKKLFSKIKLKNNILENRFVLSPITLNLATKSGFVTDEEINYALKRANSAPLSITTGANVNEQGKLFHNGIAVSNLKQIKSLKKLASAMKSQGSKAILQLIHSGRFAMAALDKFGYTKGPSALKLNFPYEHQVYELTKKEIKKTILDYQKATIIAIEAGFDGIEISSAQRLLPQAFFSKNENKRNDEYGNQNLENRSRFTLEIFEAIKKTIDQKAKKDFILGYRATPEEIIAHDIGYDFDEFIEFLKSLYNKTPFDYLALASWGKDVYKSKVRTGIKYKNKLWTETIKKEFKNQFLLMINGSINNLEKAMEAIKYCDLVGLSSVFIAEPDFVKKIKNLEFDKINLKIDENNFDKLAIPKNSFKYITNFLDFGESLPNSSRDNLKKNEKK
ncbi:oxidoreductase [[Mycoplasma] collis]|uniref:oxidoreductase n=1 Tax=[Mycoplasma] collis TaxID=2127 RepID=UPI00051B3E00|nr:NADH-dependent flavin oxidoreductase [[Mycoplasma] collis]